MAAVSAAGALALTAACTSTSPTPDPEPAVPAEWVDSAMLATYDSCDKVMTTLANRVTAAVEARGPDRTRAVEDLEAAPEAATSDDAAGGSEGKEYSETNVAEAGVDEPDVVKTDGDFLYSVHGGTLRKVDAESGAVVHEYEFPESAWNANLLLTEDSIVVFTDMDDENARGRTVHTVSKFDKSDLTPRDEVRVEGSGVDARLTGGQVRLAVSSTPEVELYTGGEPVADVLADADVSSWVPAVRTNGEEQEPSCADIAVPAEYGGGSTLTVGALDVDASWDGFDPLTVMADGQTVYGTPDALYISHSPGIAWYGPESKDETEIFRFTFNGTDPVLVGEAAVPGYLLNQYSMNEHDGHLRVATTEEPRWGFEPRGFAPEAEEKSSSTVTVFAVEDRSLEKASAIGGLGEDERIYAVRFIGDTGYVVTFRQTDPLYTVDLSDPRDPEVTGELKITGYSAYLHPMGTGRLLGVGQEADEQGRTEGMQVSLFDVSGDEAAVLDQYVDPGSHASVEFDSHAFLYWEPRSLLALPATDWSGGYSASVNLLEVKGDEISDAGEIDATELAGEGYFETGSMRTLVIGDTLWTVDRGGAVATNLDDLSDSTVHRW
ncbi:beta-propeller domain-containing protein [Salininema proteolyticum]|uniref:Beta-propeller domain-containing protein n=2 Tax=Salininema proteolyticum TaxID=1607685 RepID=A0ABV8TUP5_9ACTN